MADYSTTYSQYRVGDRVQDNQSLERGRIVELRPLAGGQLVLATVLFATGVRRAYQLWQGRLSNPLRVEARAVAEAQMVPAPSATALFEAAMGPGSTSPGWERVIRTFESGSRIGISDAEVGEGIGLLTDLARQITHDADKSGLARAARELSPRGFREHLLQLLRDPQARSRVPKLSDDLIRRLQRLLSHESLLRPVAGGAAAALGSATEAAVRNDPRLLAHLQRGVVARNGDPRIGLQARTAQEAMDRLGVVESVEVLQTARTLLQADLEELRDLRKGLGFVGPGADRYWLTSGTLKGHIWASRTANWRIKGHWAWLKKAQAFSTARGLAPLTLQDLLEGSRVSQLTQDMHRAGLRVSRPREIATVAGLLRDAGVSLTETISPGDFVKAVGRARRTLIYDRVIRIERNIKVPGYARSFLSRLEAPELDGPALERLLFRAKRILEESEPYQAIEKRLSGMYQDLEMLGEQIQLLKADPIYQSRSGALDNQEFANQLSRAVGGPRGIHIIDTDDERAARDAAWKEFQTFGFPERRPAVERRPGRLNPLEVAREGYRALNEGKKYAKRGQVVILPDGQLVRILDVQVTPPAPLNPEDVQLFRTLRDPETGWSLTEGLFSDLRTRQLGRVTGPRGDLGPLPQRFAGHVVPRSIYPALLGDPEAIRIPDVRVTVSRPFDVTGADWFLRRRPGDPASTQPKALLAELHEDLRQLYRQDPTAPAVDWMAQLESRLGIRGGLIPGELTPRETLSLTRGEILTQIRRDPRVLREIQDRLRFRMLRSGAEPGEIYSVGDLFATLPQALAELRVAAPEAEQALPVLERTQLLDRLAARVLTILRSENPARGITDRREGNYAAIDPERVASHGFTSPIADSGTPRSAALEKMVQEAALNGEVLDELETLGATRARFSTVGRAADHRYSLRELRSLARRMARENSILGLETPAAESSVLEMARMVDLHLRKLYQARSPEEEAQWLRVLYGDLEAVPRAPGSSLRQYLRVLDRDPEPVLRTRTKAARRRYHQWIQRLEAEDPQRARHLRLDLHRDDAPLTRQEYWEEMAALTDREIALEAEYRARGETLAEIRTALHAEARQDVQELRQRYRNLRRTQREILGQIRTVQRQQADLEIRRSLEGREAGMLAKFADLAGLRWGGSEAAEAAGVLETQGDALTARIRRILGEDPARVLHGSAADGLLGFRFRATAEGPIQARMAEVLGLFEELGERPDFEGSRLHQHYEWHPVRKTLDGAERTVYRPILRLGGRDHAFYFEGGQLQSLRDPRLRVQLLAQTDAQGIPQPLTWVTDATPLLSPRASDWQIQHYLQTHDLTTELAAEAQLPAFRSRTGRVLGFRVANERGQAVSPRIEDLAGQLERFARLQREGETVTIFDIEGGLGTQSERVTHIAAGRYVVREGQLTPLEGERFTGYLPSALKEYLTKTRVTPEGQVVPHEAVRAAARALNPADRFESERELLETAIQWFERQEVRNEILLGHNIAYDITSILQRAEALGIPVSEQARRRLVQMQTDSLLLGQLHSRRSYSYKLEALAVRYGVLQNAEDQLHLADFDVDLVARTWNAGLGQVTVPPVTDYTPVVLRRGEYLWGTSAQRSHLDVQGARHPSYYSHRRLYQVLGWADEQHVREIYGVDAEGNSRVGLGAIFLQEIDPRTLQAVHPDSPVALIAHTPEQISRTLTGNFEALGANAVEAQARALPWYEQAVRDLAGRRLRRMYEDPRVYVNRTLALEELFGGYKNLIQELGIETPDAVPYAAALARQDPRGFAAMEQVNRVVQEEARYQLPVAQALSEHIEAGSMTASQASKLFRAWQEKVNRAGGHERVTEMLPPHARRVTLRYRREVEGAETLPLGRERVPLHLSSPEALEQDLFEQGMRIFGTLPVERREQILREVGVTEVAKEIAHAERTAPWMTNPELPLRHAPHLSSDQLERRVVDRIFVEEIAPNLELGDTPLPPGLDAPSLRDYLLHRAQTDPALGRERADLVDLLHRAPLRAEQEQQLIQEGEQVREVWSRQYQPPGILPDPEEIHRPLGEGSPRFTWLTRQARGRTVAQLWEEDPEEAARLFGRVLKRAKRVLDDQGRPAGYFVPGLSRAQQSAMMEHLGWVLPKDLTPERLASFRNPYARDFFETLADLAPAGIDWSRKDFLESQRAVEARRLLQAHNVSPQFKDNLVRALQLRGATEETLREHFLDEVPQVGVEAVAAAPGLPPSTAPAASALAGQAVEAVEEASEALTRRIRPTAIQEGAWRTVAEQLQRLSWREAGILGAAALAGIVALGASRPDLRTEEEREADQLGPQAAFASPRFVGRRIVRRHARPSQAFEIVIQGGMPGHLDHETVVRTLQEALGGEAPSVQVQDSRRKVDPTWIDEVTGQLLTQPSSRHAAPGVV